MIDYKIPLSPPLKKGEAAATPEQEGYLQPLLLKGVRGILIGS